MDEEDLYSAVGRQAHAAGPDEHEAGQEDDSLNADTFGSASVSAANNGAAPARPAWTSAGASVALVAGSNRWVAVPLLLRCLSSHMSTVEGSLHRATICALWVIVQLNRVS